MLSRRGLISSALASIPAAALRPLLAAVPVLETYNGARNSLLTLDMINREAIRLFTESNAFLKNISGQYEEEFDQEYEEEFGREDAQIGTTLRIRLPYANEVRDA
jgi:hypothetical protein